MVSSLSAENSWLNFRHVIDWEGVLVPSDRRAVSNGMDLDVQAPSDTDIGEFEGTVSKTRVTYLCSLPFSFFNQAVWCTAQGYLRSAMLR